MNTNVVPSWVPPYVIPFFSLSYPTDPPLKTDSFHNSQYFGTGWLDICTIVGLIAAMAILRDLVRLYVFEPFALWKLSKDLRAKKLAVSKNGGPWSPSLKAKLVSNGVASGHQSNGDVHEVTFTAVEKRRMHRSVLRFAEQGWALLCYSFQCGFGFYVHHNFPTKMLFPGEGIWSRYPHYPLPGPVKFYYLNETAFYIHGIFVLTAEARRKDHIQMVAHHVIAITLMFLSYAWNFTRIGCLIMVLMDVCDVLLPVAKMIKYMGGSLSCDIVFGLFMVGWFITRHILFTLAIVSTYVDAPHYLPFKWDSVGGHYLTYNVYIGFIVLMSLLQVRSISSL
ncbi:longevity assurance proteins LAG1/LAC1 [Thelephora ganbajun]|uniref:Longevity assurance proteins LAG1/LAC1 n=1 Tax=Thelephora ganbajun TaxID=370292 RepID=A0ACB6ZC28_THEGA|nr:longevity assurance proteins LAG1/LAC1 [Thelephora ganbajun]